MQKTKKLLMFVVGVFGLVFAIEMSYGAVNELKIAVDFDMTEVDPAKLRTSTDRLLVVNVYNGLLKFRPESCEIENDLAESYDISPDGKVFTFKLRKGVKFHKGYGELISSDVKFSLMRHLDPKTKSREFMNLSVIDQIETPDRYTVKVFLKRPSMGFLGLLAYHGGAILSEKAANELGDKISHQPIGTGPFQWGGWLPGSEIVLNAHEDYFLGSPKIKKLVFKIIPDPSVSFNAVQKGDIDYYQVMNTGAYRSMLKIKDRNFKLLKPFNIDIGYAWVNSVKEPTKHWKVRQALAHAIDFEGLVKGFGGMVEPNPSVLPRALPSWTDKLPTYKYEVELAKKLLKEAGFERPKLNICYLKVENYEEYAVMLKGYLSKIADVELVLVDLARWADVARGRDWDLYVVSPTRPTEDLYASGSFHSRGPNNFSGYVNPQLDEIVEKADKEVDFSKRKALYVRMQEIMATDLPILVLASGNGVVIMKKSLEGIYPEAHPGVAKFNTAYFK
jgi:peptide/nickel transport system substrate-binding protein